MAERYKLGDIDNERFYQIPKSLFKNPKYKSMSNTSKIMYAILKDRMGLSRKNKWNDGNGDIYLLFSQDDMADLLGVNKSTIVRNMKELTDSHLIDSVRQGLGKPNKIYINRPERFQENAKTRSAEYAKIATLKSAQCNPNDTDVSETENNDTYMGAKPHRKRKVFTPPTLEEVEAHIAEKGLHINAKAFVDYYEADDWHLSNGKKMQNWRRCCTTWENNRYGASKPMKQTTQADYEDLLRELENDDKQSGYCQADS
jgi:hypothetical protein